MVQHRCYHFDISATHFGLFKWGFGCSLQLLGFDKWPCETSFLDPKEIEVVMHDIDILPDAQSSFGGFLTPLRVGRAGYKT